jgi:glycosyltransferase involved in cell wall biosynthesis
MNSLSFSILIPVYNGEKYLEDCLNSVLPQLGPGDEVLIHDDGSTDRTGEILADWPIKLNVSRDINGGVSRSRNVLAKRATGDFLVFLDADDLLAPEALIVFRQALEVGIYDCGLTPILFFNNDLKHPLHVFYKEAPGLESDPLEFFIKRIPPAAALIISRALFLKIGGFCPFMEHSEEFELVVHAQEFKPKWIFIPDIVRRNRVHSGPRASHNLKMCTWRAVTVLHSIYRGRYRVTLKSHHIEILLADLYSRGRLLFRINERKLASITFSFADKIRAKHGLNALSLYDHICQWIGYYPSEQIRSWLNFILRRNQWGQKEH